MADSILSGRFPEHVTRLIHRRRHQGNRCAVSPHEPDTCLLPEPTTVDTTSTVTRGSQGWCTQEQVLFHGARLCAYDLGDYTDGRKPRVWHTAAV